MGNSRLIHAAGGLLWRERDSMLQVAVVHRPAYDDWSLPKGKARAGEIPVLTAVREVSEETGAAVAATRRLGQVSYTVREGAKLVRYWAMRYDGGEFEPNDEVDDLVWFDLDRARRLLSYAGDRSIVDAVSPTALPTSMVVLVRHAKAGKRSDWAGRDHLRPLDRTGRGQARTLVDVLSVFKPERILSAEPVRCVQTVQPLANRCGLRIELADAFSDEGFTRDPEAAQAELLSIARSGQVTIACSQGMTIPALIDGLALARTRRSAATAKGASWALGCRDGRIVSADYYRAPSGQRPGAAAALNARQSESDRTPPRSKRRAAGKESPGANMSHRDFEVEPTS